MSFILHSFFMGNSKHSNTVLINLVMSSIIPFLIWGPFFPDLIVSISALFFLYHTFKEKNFYYFDRVGMDEIYYNKKYFSLK